ncbi:MAG TPA: hypothetical protein VGI65_06440 [Steroidobacteraceae bacterium]|jgi:hypothetical protein
MNNAYVAGLLSGFIGGIAGAFLLLHLGVGTQRGPGTAPLRAGSAAERTVIAQQIQLIDAAGRTRAQLAMAPDGAPGLFFYDTKGRNRLVLGLYAPTESEYPFVVLNDTNQKAAGIFRLFGANETPVVVLKNKAADRSILGLNPDSTDPFLVYYSRDGKKTELFGNF